MKLEKTIVKLRIPILILAALLLIPSLFGMLNTRINYDMLNYLPSDMETVQGQQILLDDFGKGAFSFVIVENMENKDVSALKEKIEQVEHVDTVLWYDSLADLSVPMEILPEKYYNIFNSGDATMLAVFFDTSTSADETITAIRDIRALSGKQVFVSGMSAMVTDLKILCEQEEPIYVALAVVLACVAMMIFLDSWILPLVFLASIGAAILLNLGTNYFFGEISYITKALSAVLQLGVTMDYSIFLWHSYSEQKEKHNDRKDAMAAAIHETFSSVVGSSVTTVAGFIALCFMSFTLGADLGIVMAKGVVLGVIGCVTTLPALILVTEPLINKTHHRPLIPDLHKLSSVITKIWPVFLVTFVVIMVPAVYGYTKTEKYYDISLSLPQDMDNVVANTKLQENFNTGSTHMLLVSAELPSKEVRSMLDEMEQVDGVTYTLGMESVVGSLIPKEILPESVTSALNSGKWKLVLISSSYKTASDEVNEQIETLNDIVKSYEEDGMLIGEAPCTKDLIEITDHDFKVVNAISIIAIFIIIALVLQSVSLPVILVTVIECAIFINLGIPFYTNTALPFVAPICISTIQLGATVDYAILMTTRYKKERINGSNKKEAITTALVTSMPSIIVSAMGFFAATYGVGLYSDIDMISSMCSLMARGAIISMVTVILVLPSLFMLLDGVICKTTLNMRKK